MKTTSHTVGTHLMLEVPLSGTLIDREAFTGAIHILVGRTSLRELPDADVREIVEEELKRCLKGS